MSCRPNPPPLTDEQKAQISGILSVGCDRQTAADFVGCMLADIRHAMQSDAAFLASIRRAEAAAELSHMRNVQEAAKEKRDWRASVWWLERRSPERFARRSPGTVTVRQLKAFVAILVDAVSSDVTNADDRRRISARLREIAASVEQLLRDAQAHADDAAEGASPSQNDDPPSNSTESCPSGLLGVHYEDS